MSATGQTSVVLNDSVSYDPQNGSTIRKRSKHKTRALAEAYVYSVPGFNAYKWSITPMDMDDWHEVVMESVNGSYSGNGNTTVNNDPNAPLVDVFELVPTLAEKDLLESDQADVRTLTEDDKKTILADSVKDGSTVVYTGTNAAIKNKILRLIIGGLKTVRIFAPTLRHTRIMRRDFTVQQAYDKVGRIFTTATLKTYEGVPAQVLFGIPNDSDPSRGDGLTVHYGWLKKPASIQQISGGQWQIVQEYDWGLWAEALYGTAL